ncbi:MAG: hypothetical protein IKA70_03260 [Alistipes sp.]|nr:hypothetical protein [Alistipes sp.]
MKKLRFIVLAVVAMLISAATVVAQEKPQGLKLPSVVGSDMVLQHSSTVNIWGWAKPKAKVKIQPSWVESKKPLQVKADENGFWKVEVQTLAAGYTPYTITIKAGKETKELTNIVFGEVWLCSGQSNMEWPVRKTPDMRGDLKKKMNTNIRLYCTGRISATTPQDDVPVQAKHTPHWAVCNAKDLATFSAVAYGFGKELQEALDVPVGLIDASYGGTPVEGWIGVEARNANEKLAAVCAKSKNKKWKSKLSALHNANIYPIRHTTIAGTIWYQGCSNVKYGGYATMLNGLINSWRTEFRNPTMPFYIVEIVPHTYAGIRGAFIREAQARVAARQKNCEIVITNDQNCVPGDIHPPLKKDVSHRLAQCALGGHYHKTTAEFRSPAYKSMVVEGDAIRVYFKNVPTTLVKKGEGRINGFQLGVKDPNDPKGKKLIFSLAEATIEGNTILVKAEGVTAPVAVRYCFNEDMGNVFSAEGLPLGAFRSDRANTSLSARPYIETPNAIAVKVEGEGYEKGTFGQDAPLWSELWALSEVRPTEFDGLEFLVSQDAGKGKAGRPCRVTALEDGKLYVLTAIAPAIRKSPWRVLTSTYTFPYAVKTKKKGVAFYIVERPVKAGETIDLPKTKSRWGYSVLAKSIEY